MPRRRRSVAPLQLVTIEYVFKRIGPAEFRDEWISNLTREEDWVLRAGRADISALSRESLRVFEQAQHREAFFEYQRAWVYEWLKENNIRIINNLYGLTDAVDKRAFDAEFRIKYPIRSDHPASKVLKRPTAAQLKAFYLSYMSRFTPGIMPPQRDDDVKAAQAYFDCKGLRDPIRQLRRDHAPPEWKKTGNKGRKAHQASRRSG